MLPTFSANGKFHFKQLQASTVTHLSINTLANFRCKTTLGWKYEHAYENSQKYKEGKYIIELVHMFKDNGWKDQWQYSHGRSPTLITSRKKSNLHFCTLFRYTRMRTGKGAHSFVLIFSSMHTHTLHTHRHTLNSGTVFIPYSFFWQNCYQHLHTFNKEVFIQLDESFSTVWESDP